MKNAAKLTGRLTDVYTLPENPSICEAIIVCTRKSGAVDQLPIRFPNKNDLLREFQQHQDQLIAVVGEMRTYNNTDPSIAGRHKSTYLWVDGFFFDTMDALLELNSVELEGVIVHKGELRETPLGRYICDLVIAVPTSNDKTSYINILVWNKTASFMADYGKIGDQISLSGRFQSREYRKDGETRTAYEVSSSYVSVKENGQQ